MARGKDLTGERFGKLTVLGKTGGRKNNYVVWRCRCDCGGEIDVDTHRLKRGTVTDCGCVDRTTARRGNVAEDLTGQVFGALTVLERTENRNGRTCWLCRCVCGREKSATAHDLKAGKVKSCGCLTYEYGHNRLDIAGERFGRLTALYPTKKRDARGSVFWHCRCDCGNETDVSAAGLTGGNYLSCGCLKKENQKNISQQLHHVDGTCVEILEKRKHRRDNTSGFRGVCHMKNGRYRADIGFRGKRYYLGVFDTFEEAVDARLEAEGSMHGRFLEQYHAWKEKSDADPGWGREHPFEFRV